MSTYRGCQGAFGARPSSDLWWTDFGNYVTIQAQLLNLLKDLHAAFGLTVLFISHNLSVVRQMSDDVIVLRAGQIQEQCDPGQVYENPAAG